MHNLRSWDFFWYTYWGVWSLRGFFLATRHCVSFCPMIHLLGRSVSYTSESSEKIVFLHNNQFLHFSLLQISKILPNGCLSELQLHHSFWTWFSDFGTRIVSKQTIWKTVHLCVWQKMKTSCSRWKCPVQLINPAVQEPCDHSQITSFDPLTISVTCLSAIRDELFFLSCIICGIVRGLCLWVDCDVLVSTQLYFWVKNSNF